MEFILVHKSTFVNLNSNFEDKWTRKENMHLSTANENDQRGCQRVNVTSPPQKSLSLKL